jgi:hypothetical protein
MKFLARISLFLITVLLLLGPALYLGRDSLAPTVISWIVRAGLGLDDLGPLGFQIADLRSDGLKLKSLTAGAGVVEADTVEVTYQLSDLWRGQIKSVTISGVTLRAAVKDDRLDLGPLSPLLAASPQEATSEASERFPFDDLILNTARVVIETPWGTADLVGDVSGQQSPEGVFKVTGVLDGEMTSDALGGGTASFNISADGIRRPGGVLEANLSLARGVASFGDLSARKVKGSFDFRSPIDETSIGRASLTMEDVRIGRHMTSMTALDVLTRGDSGSMTLSVGGAVESEAPYKFAASIEGGHRSRFKLAFAGDGPIHPLYRLLGAALESSIDDPRGDLAFQGNITLPGPVSSFLTSPGDGAATAVGTGGLELSISSVRDAGQVHDARLRAKITGIVAPGVVELRLEDGWGVQVPASLSQKLAPLAPEIFRHWFDGDVSVGPDPNGQRPSVLIDYRGEHTKALISGTLGGNMGPDRGVELGGRVGVQRAESASGSGWSAELDDVTLGLRGFDTEDFFLRNGEAWFNGRVGTDSANGTFGLKGEGTASVVGFSGDAEATLLGRVATKDNKTRISFDELNLRSSELNHLASGAFIMTPVMISRSPGTIPQIVYARNLGGYLIRDVKADLDIGTVILGLLDGDESLSVSVGVDHVTGRFKDDGASVGGRIQLTMGQATIDTGNVPMAISGAMANAVFHRNAGERELEAFELEISGISTSNQPAWFAPLGIRLSGTLPEKGKALTLSGALSSSDGAIELPFTGILRPKDGTGQINLVKTTVKVEPGSMTLEKISPFLAEQIDTLSARISLEGYFRWPEYQARDAQRFSIEIDDITVDGQEYSVGNARGNIAFSSLWPLRTDGVRSIAMETLGIGVPIDHPRIEMSVDGIDRVKIHRVSGGFAGGTLSAENIDLSKDKPTQLTMQVNGVSATELSNLVKVEGLEAEGTLSGVLPVTWTPGLGLAVIEAKLTSDGPGTVRYEAGDREEALRDSGEQVGLMLDALSDFHFKTLGVNLDGTPGEGYRIALALEGANPNLYDGYPVRFNLNLSGQLDDIIKTGYRTYSLPTRVRDAVLQGEGRE